MGLTQLIGHGLVTCDSFGGLRRLITPPSKRRGVMRRVPLAPAGRWSRFRAARSIAGRPALGSEPASDEREIELVARQLLSRYGVIFRKLLDRERIPVPWRDLVRVYRLEELRGEVRGGRFVQRFAGEQYALPEAIELMRRLRRRAGGAQAHAEGHAADQAARLHVAAADPLNLEGILTPEPRVPVQARRRVPVG